MNTNGKVSNASFVPTLVVGAGKLKQLLWYFCNLLFLRNPLLPGSAIRVGILRCFGAQVGRGVVIKPSVNIKYPWKLRVGNHAWIGEQVWIDNLATVTIGDDCCISQGALLLCGNHDYRLSSFDLITGDITLEAGVWIGAKALVAPGVTCCTHAVLTAGSVATQTLEAYGIYQGNPAVKIRTRQIN